MQKTIKRTISILLSILMIVSLFTIVPITASAVTQFDISDLSQQMDMLAHERDEQGDYEAADALMSFSQGLYYAYNQSEGNADDPNVERAYNIALAVYNHFNGTGSVNVTSVSSIEVEELTRALNDLMADYMMSDDYYNAKLLHYAEEILEDAYHAASGDDDQNLLSAYSLVSFILAQYTGTTGSYTVTWNNWDGSVLETDENVAADSTPSYDGSTPTKADDAQNTYTFSGWSDGTNTYGATDTLPAVAGDITYTATFTATPKLYTVTWGNNILNNGTGGISSGGVTLTTQQAKTRVGNCFYDGRGSATFTAPEGSVFTKIEIKDCSYVDSLNFPGATVAESGGYWDGWDPDDQEWVACYTVTWTGESSEVTFSGAVYGIQSIVFTLKSVAPTTYTVTWKNGDTTLETDTVDKDAIPVYDGETPTKPEDENYTYTFSGWSDGETTYAASDNLPAVTGDVTYTAQFDATPKLYTITWKNEDGSLIDTAQVAYGDTPSYDGEEPTKSADAHYTYTFSGWTPEIVAVEGDAEYTATFDREEITVPHGPQEDGTFYWLGEKQRAYTLIEFDGDYYLVAEYHKYAKNQTRYLNASMVEGTDFAIGYYYFDAEGKMQTLRNGPMADGCFYRDNERLTAYQLAEYNGDWYFICENHKYAVNATRYLNAAMVEGTDFAPGYYSFDESGKMIVKNGPNADGYFYKDNERLKAYQLVEYNGDLYFIAENHKYSVDQRRYLNAAMVEGTDLAPGYYNFDSEGKMAVILAA